MVLLNAGSAQKDRHRLLGEQITQRGYWWTYRVMDTAQVTGFPVQERKIILIGGPEEGNQRFGFSKPRTPVPDPPELFLEPEHRVDPWYFRVRRSEDVPLQEGTRFYCWNGHGYAGTDHVTWNPWRVPLVWDGGTLRKITHREIANLKGFPGEYSLPVRDKNRLYTKLMYAGNVIVIRQAADYETLCVEFLKAARDCLRETGKLILCLSDNDLLKMNALQERGDGDPVDVLGEKLDALLIDLEK